MRHWKITRSKDVGPTPGSLREYARTYFVVPIAGGTETQTTVEFDELAPRATKHAALRALRPFLEIEDPPPRRLYVGRGGDVSVLDE